MKTRPSLQDLDINHSNDFNVKESEEECFDFLYSASTTSSCKSKKWSRKRKSNNQISILIEEYAQNTKWTKEKVVSLAEKTGLSEAQVYKWSWDYKKKLKKHSMNFNFSELICSEIMPPSNIDSEMIKLQKNYKQGFSLIGCHIPTPFFFNDI